MITRPKAAISGLFAEERGEAVEKTSGWVGAALVAVVLFAQAAAGRVPGLGAVAAASAGSPGVSSDYRIAR